MWFFSPNESSKLNYYYDSPFCKTGTPNTRKRKQDKKWSTQCMIVQKRNKTDVSVDDQKIFSEMGQNVN